ncbi:calmodulin-related protein 97A-like [Teleopsis dalmanni]|uniref:calmodulin-related protein 97A-like n=1 Tax=Teleopsis dalmanni TaxID=139649 RepID=UPI0018CC8DCE|nr:calmodulin-related protein 97A-like [Teleopsis dalmanni]
MAKELTDEQLALLKDMFYEFTEANEQKLAAEKFTSLICWVCAFLCHPISTTEAQVITQEHDDGSGLFDFDKFITVITIKMIETYTTENMLTYFKNLDTESKGFLTADDLRLAFANNMTEDEIQKAVSYTSDGKLKFEDFFKFMNPFKE